MEAQLFLQAPPRVMGLDKEIRQVNSLPPAGQDLLESVHNLRETVDRIYRINLRTQDSVFKIDTLLTRKVEQETSKINIHLRKIVEQEVDRNKREKKRESREKQERDLSSKILKGTGRFQRELTSKVNNLGKTFVEALLDTLFPGLGRMGLTGFLTKSLFSVGGWLLGGLAAKLLHPIRTLKGLVKIVRSIPKNIGEVLTKGGDLVTGATKTATSWWKGTKIAGLLGNKSSKAVAGLGGVDWATKYGRTYNGVALEGLETGTKVAKEGGILGKMSGLLGKKTLSKGVLKTIGKKIPVIGLILGLGLAVQRASVGDWTGAIMEAGSGALSIIPGWGTVASLGLDVAIMKRDLSKEKKKNPAEKLMSNMSDNIEDMKDSVDEWTNGIKNKARDFISLAKSLIKGGNLFESLFMGGLLGGAGASGQALMPLYHDMAMGIDFDNPEVPYKIIPPKKTGTTSVARAMSPKVRNAAPSFTPLSDNLIQEIPSNLGSLSTYEVNGVKDAISLYDLKALGVLHGDISKGNSKPYVAQRYVARLLEMDNFLTSQGLNVVYTSAMGGDHAKSSLGRGHVEGAKVDWVLNTRERPPQYVLDWLEKRGFTGSETGAVGWHNAGSGYHVDASLWQKPSSIPSKGVTNTPLEVASGNASDTSVVDLDRAFKSVKDRAFGTLANSVGSDNTNTSSPQIQPVIINNGGSSTRGLSNGITLPSISEIELIVPEMYGGQG